MGYEGAFVMAMAETFKNMWTTSSFFGVWPKNFKN